MFCSNCGAQMEDSDLFCPNCGAKVVNVDEGQEASVEQEPSVSGNTAPVYAAVAAPSSVSGVSVWKYVGVFSALLGFLSLFLKYICIDIPDSVADFMSLAGVRDSDASWNFYQFMKDAEVAWIFWLTIVFIALVIVLQLTNHPKLSLIGCFGMLFGNIFVAIGLTQLPVRVRHFVKYGFGFYLLIFATILCFLSAFLTKKRRK